MKINTDKVELMAYKKPEEVLNVLTHLIGLVIPYLIITRCLPLCEGKPFCQLTAILYALGTAFTFTASVVYHSIPNSRAKKIMRMVDHCAIFFAVAGTITGTVPAVFEKGSAVGAVLMLIVGWLSAVAGLILTLFYFEKTDRIRMLLYICAAVFSAILGSKTFFHLPIEAFLCLLSGGIILLIGCVLLGIGRRKRYVHPVFHIFIDSGLGIFYWGIYEFVYSLL